MYVVKEGKALQIPVEVGDRVGNRIEISKGLTGTEQVIVSGKDLVTTGTPVDPRPLEGYPKPR